MDDSSTNFSLSVLIPRFQTALILFSRSLTVIKYFRTHYYRLLIDTGTVLDTTRTLWCRLSLKISTSTPSREYSNAEKEVQSRNLKKSIVHLSLAILDYLDESRGMLFERTVSPEV